MPGFERPSAPGRRGRCVGRRGRRGRDRRSEGTDASSSGGTTADTTTTTFGTTDGTGGTTEIPTPRRPFLVAGELRSASAAAGDAWSDGALPSVDDLDEATRTFLARAWQKDALEEHASIAAFARWTLLLLSVAAPPDLVARAQRAASDEIRHAKLCFALAARYGGAGVAPGPLAIDGAIRPLSLAELAELATEEGCVGETLGALIAAEQARVADDPAARRILLRIARDESRHAELSWMFVRWAVTTGGAPVLAAVREAAARAIASSLRPEVRSYAGIDLDALHAHGRLTCAESRQIVQRAIGEVLEPCLADPRGLRRPDTARAPRARVTSVHRASRARRVRARQQGHNAEAIRAEEEVAPSPAPRGS